MFILPTIYNNGEKREKKDVDAKEAKEQGFFLLVAKMTSPSVMGFILLQNPCQQKFILPTET